MSNELRIFPPSSTNPTTLKQDKGSNSVPVVHDTLAHGPSSTVTSLNARHPLESQVKNWNAQQEQLKLELAKRLGGIGEVVRIGTEKMIACNDFQPVALGGPSNVHLDIINGKDTKIDIGDIYNDTELAHVPFHVELERRLGI